MDSNLILGFIGGAVGVLGGVVGTYFSIHNTKTPPERRFMVRAAFGAWFCLFLFLGVLFLVPVPWRWLAWLPYAIILPLGVRYMNQRQNALREGEHNT